MIWDSKLRPDWVDWDVYQRVRVKREPVERVARSAWLSPEQVLRWVERVTVYLIAVASQSADEAKGETGEQRYGRELASEQLAHLAERAMAAFDLSCGPQTVIRQGSGGRPQATTRRSFGDIRYLLAAGRLIKLGEKMLPARTGRMFIGNGSALGAEVEWVPDDRYPTFAAAALQISPAEEEAIKQRYAEWQVRCEQVQAAELAQREQALADMAEIEEGNLPGPTSYAELEEAAEELEDSEEDDGEQESEFWSEEDGKNHLNRDCSRVIVEQSPEWRKMGLSDHPTVDELRDYVERMKAERDAKQPSNRTVQRPVRTDDPGGMADEPRREKSRARRDFFRG